MTEANGSAELRLEYVPVGRNGSATLTARFGDEILGHAKVDLGKPKARAEFAEALAKGRPGIDSAVVEKELMRIGADLARHQAKGTNEKPGQPDNAELLGKMPEHFRREARAMLESPDLMQRVIDDVAALGVAGERELVASVYLVGISRLLPRPLAAIVQAPSSVGKTYTVGKVAELFPAEAVIHATSLTPQALFYMPLGSLSHRLIVAGERSRREDDESAEATRALREMISSRRLTKLVPMKEDGRFVTQTIDQPGPIAFVETTTLTKIFDEDANRCLLLSADERTQQTTAVVNRLATDYGGTATTDVEAIVQRHHAAQRMLQQRPVVVPFAEKIAVHFPRDRVEARRAFPHLMGMIQASALLHQFQRQIDGDGRIVAGPDDYQLARHLARGPLARLLGGRISDAALRYHDRLATWAANLDSFTTTQAVKHDRASDRAIRGWLHELASVGAIEQVNEGKGSRPATWRLLDIDRSELEAGDCGLPSVEEISL